MRVTEKLSLIDKLSRELQARFGYAEIDHFLSEFGIEPPENVTANSKWVYSKAAMKGVPEAIIVRIATELGFVDNGIGPSELALPRNWQDTSQFKLFISHISMHKLKATRLKECLASLIV